MALQITGNNNFEFITYNYDPSLVDSINGTNNNISKNDVRNIINGTIGAHSEITNMPTFKKQFYTSPFINMSEGVSITSEKDAYDGLLTMGAPGRNKAIPPFPGSLVNINDVGNTTGFVRSRFDYDELINVIVEKFNNVGKNYNPQDIAAILNGTSASDHDILTELNMSADNFCKAIFQLPVKNFNELGLYSEVFSINSLFNATDENAAQSLAIPSFDTIPPANPVITFPPFTNNTTPLYVTLTDDVVKWEYSVDNATSWTTLNVTRDNTGNITSDTFFTLDDNTTYSADHIQIRAYDYTGNSSTTKNGGTVEVKSAHPNVSARLLSSKTSIEIIFDDTIVLNSPAASDFNFNQIPAPNITAITGITGTNTTTLVLTINNFTTSTTPLTIGFNTNKIKDKYGNTIDIANQNIFIEQNVELYLNKNTSDLWCKTAESNINVFQLNFIDVNITSISDVLTDFNVLLGANGKSMVGYATNTATNLAPNAWAKLMKIDLGSGSNFDTIALANNHNIFTDGTINYNTIGFTLDINNP